MFRDFLFRCLLSDILKTTSENNKNIENNTPKKDDKKTVEKTKPWKYPKGNTKFSKIFGAAVIFLIIYLIFGYGRTQQLTIKSISTSGQEVTISDHYNKDYIISIKDMHKHVYSEKLNEKTTRIFAKTRSGDNISFNVSSNWELNKDKDSLIFSVISDSGELCFWNLKTSETSQGCKNLWSTNAKNSGSESFYKLISFAINQPSNPNRITPVSVFFSLLPTILYLGVFVYLMRSTMKGSMGIYGKNSIFKLGDSISDTTKARITFKDVAGIEEEKLELEEIVDFLKNPKKYSVMGARTPKGVILYGPPGTGKTLLAKAVSGEANVPFIETSGASFDDMFVGVGAKRVRELFEKAKKIAPCIVFIDEIDALAGKRSGKYNSGAANDQTINQLLSEMDGFGTNNGVIIVAATNRLSSIDEAVLRPGRFDRHIQVSLPDIAGRIEILKIHAKNKNISTQVAFEDIARKTPGFSGAQLENVLNEAALLSVRNDKKIIGNEEISEAIDRVIAGPAKKNKKVTFEERRLVAFHEAGHAIAGLYARDGDVVEKITIIPRGQAAGYMLSAPKKQETFIKTKDELLSSVLTTLAGRAAEELFFGKQKISSGASNDLYKATETVKSMVLKLGMSDEIGLVQYIPTEDLENPYKNAYSEKMAEKIDLEIRIIINEQYENAKKIIEENKEEYLLIVETLLLLETIDKKQIDYIHEKKEIPEEAKKIKELLFKNKKNVDVIKIKDIE